MLMVLTSAAGCIAPDGDVEELEGFRADVDAARSILYIADNAGEIVFDPLLPVWALWALAALAAAPPAPIASVLWPNTNRCSGNARILSEAFLPLRSVPMMS